MKLTKLWKTATLATLVGLGALAAADTASAQVTFRYNSGPRYDNRYDSGYRTCDRYGRNCVWHNYGRSAYNYNNNDSRGRYWVCDRYNRCAWTPYPRTYYQRYPRAGFSFGFSF